jgi:predicted alpha/beta hydrolase
VWYLLVPATTALVGYVPASWFKLGEDLPKGVAYEWRSWCLSPTYFKPFFGDRIPQTHFENIRIPMHFLFPEDDLIATDRSVKQLRAFYTSAPATIEKVMLADHGLKAVGHLGYFSRKAQQALWPKTLAFLHDLR